MEGGGGGAFDANPQSRDGQKGPFWIGLMYIYILRKSQFPNFDPFQRER